MPLSWDIFCRVIDNYGDAAVCWRLARQLANEQHAPVRLWVDRLTVLHALCPEVDTLLPQQRAVGVEVRAWEGGWPGSTEPHDVVVEAFGCGLPDACLTAMVERAPRPLWVTLEYLSAEGWVAKHHALPSPHPRYRLERYFFFPGVTPGTGGVLREAGLDARRAAFGRGARTDFWCSLGREPPPEGSVTVSLFAYASAPVEALLQSWERGAEPVIVVVPEGYLTDRVRAYFGSPGGTAENSFKRGRLEACLVPFLSQTRYDELLWSCDVNLIRGEDSFVRAQWAERPFVWHIYPQHADAHRLKLDAFLDTYSAAIDRGAAAALRNLHYQWNLMEGITVNLADAWRDFRRNARTLAAHAPVWASRVAQVGDMARNLARFARDRVK